MVEAIRKVKKTVRDIELKGKRVLLRVDFNVPLDMGSGAISDDSRIWASLPTIRHILDQGGSLVICSHVGRPQKRHDPELSMRPVADRLARLVGAKVRFTSGDIEAVVKTQADCLKPGEVLMLENIRFYEGEEANDPEFSRVLASLADVFVNDAFGTAHRAHASTEGVTRHIPAVAGLLMEKEIEILGQALEEPERPLAAIIGGAKVKDKIAFVQHMIGKVDVMIIGGGMSATFLKAKGYDVGRSLLEPEWIQGVVQLYSEAGNQGTTILLPHDMVVAESLQPDARSRIVDIGDMPESWLMVDIGPETRGIFTNTLSRCKTVIWNGPMGIFEIAEYSKGTRVIAEALSELTATTVVGGGSTVDAVRKLGLADRFSHLSTGGGASLELLEGRVLPGIAALPDK